eukprot:1125-Heterococcus_DN1.PRE.2
MRSLAPLTIAAHTHTRTDTTHRFSNNVSSGADGTSSIEASHNTLHLAVGGFDMRVPGNPDSAGWGVAGANGDMGENETAGFDPIFFFHHCNIDRVFWLWQQRHGQTERLDIDPTGAIESGQTPFSDGQKLTVDTALKPFVDSNGKDVTSADVTDIRALGYTYSTGSLEDVLSFSDEQLLARRTPQWLQLEGVDTSKFTGSFLVRLLAEWQDAAGEEHTELVARIAVLSRWAPERCSNCVAHNLKVATNTQAEPMRILLLVLMTTCCSSGAMRHEHDVLLRIHPADLHSDCGTSLTQVLHSLCTSFLQEHEGLTQLRWVLSITDRDATTEQPITALVQMLAKKVQVGALRSGESPRLQWQSAGLPTLRTAAAAAAAQKLGGTSLKWRDASAEGTSVIIATWDLV